MGSLKRPYVLPMYRNFAAEFSNTSGKNIETTFVISLINKSTRIFVIEICLTKNQHHGETCLKNVQTESLIAMKKNHSLHKIHGKYCRTTDEKLKIFGWEKNSDIFLSKMSVPYVQVNSIMPV